MNIYSEEKSRTSSQILSKTVAVSSYDKQYFEIFNTWRRYDLLTTIFTTFGLFIAILNYELDILNKKMIIYNINLLEQNKIVNAMESDIFINGYNIPIRYLMAVTTILSIVSLVLRHQQKVKWINEYFNLSLQREKHHAARSLHYYYNQAIMGNSDDLMQSRKDFLVK